MTTRVPDGFPVRTLDVQRALCVVQDIWPGKLPEVVDELYRLLWVERVAVNSVEVFGPVLKRILGEKTGSEVLETAGSRGKEALARNTDAAVRNGAFGMPWFVGQCRRRSVYAGAKLIRTSQLQTPQARRRGFGGLITLARSCTILVSVKRDSKSCCEFVYTKGSDMTIDTPCSSAFCSSTPWSPTAPSCPLPANQSRPTTSPSTLSCPPRRSRASRRAPTY